MQSIDIFEPLIAVVISSHVIRQFFCKIAHIVISIIHNTFWSARVRNDGVTSFLLSATHACMVKYCFGIKFSKLRFWWIYTIWDSLNNKIKFLAVGLCVCVCTYIYMCVCVCYLNNSKTNYSKNSKFGILHMYQKYMLIKIFF